jgi:cell division protein FtsB
MPMHRSHLRFAAALTGCVVAFGALTIFGTNGAARLLKLRADQRALTDRAFQLLQENEALRDRIVRLHHDDRFLESVARERLGLVGDREIVYRFPEAQPPPAEPGG